MSERLDIRVARSLAWAWLLRDVRVGGGRLAFLAGLAPILGGTFWTSAFAASMLATSGTPRFLFSAAGFLVASAVVAVMVASQFAAAVLDSRDMELLGPRPINARTYVGARVAAASLYTLMLALPAHLPFALLGTLAPGSSNGFALAYLAVAVPTAIAGTTVLILAYVTLARFLGIRRLHAALTLIQVLLAVGLWPLIPLVTRATPPSALFAIADSGAMRFLPPAWLAATVDVLLGHADPRTLAMAAAGTAALVIFIAVLPRYLSLDYARTALGQLAGLSDRYAKPRPSGWNPLVRAGFDLARQAIRDPRLMARLAPGLVMPFLYGFALLVVYGDVDPYGGATGSFAIAPAAMLSMVPPGFIIALQRSDKWRAGYIFDIAPLTRPYRIILGVEIAAGLLYLIPAGALVLWGALRWPPEYAGLLGLDLLAALGVTLAVAPFFIDRLPFCLPAEASSGLRERMGSVLGMLLPLSTALVVRFATGADLGLHAWVDAAVFATGALLHAFMLRVLDVRLRQNFARGQAVAGAQVQRFASRAVSVGLGLVTLGLGAVFMAIPGLVAFVDATAEGLPPTIETLRATQARRAAQVAARQGDSGLARRLAQMAIADDPSPPNLRLLQDPVPLQRDQPPR